MGVWRGGSKWKLNSIGLHSSIPSRSTFSLKLHAAGAIKLMLHLEKGKRGTFQGLSGLPVICAQGALMSQSGPAPLTRKFQGSSGSRSCSDGQKVLLVSSL